MNSRERRMERRRNQRGGQQHSAPSVLNPTPAVANLTTESSASPPIVRRKKPPDSTLQAPDSAKRAHNTSLPAGDKPSGQEASTPARNDHSIQATTPVSGFTALARKTMPDGIMRTKTGTYVTRGGKTAYYPRQGRDYDSWDLDSDGNFKDPHSDHSSYVSVDEDDYSFDTTACTSSFGFTAHPSNYFDYHLQQKPKTKTEVPISTITLLRSSSATLERDISDAWSTTDPTTNVRHRTALLSLAGAITRHDGNMAQLSTRQSNILTRLTAVQQQLTTTMDQLVATSKEVEVLSNNISDNLYTSLSEDDVNQMIDDAITNLPASALASTKKHIAALERASKSRLASYAASLRIPDQRAPSEHNSPPTTNSAGGPSVQSQDAPADHDGSEGSPYALRGGVDTTTPGNDGDSECGYTYPPPRHSRGTMPTPWSTTMPTAANLGPQPSRTHSPPPVTFSARNNMARNNDVPEYGPRDNDYYSGYSTRNSRFSDDLPHTTSLPSYTITTSVPLAAKVWHGGGSATMFMDGVPRLSFDAVRSLGLVSSTIHPTILIHNHVFSHWNRDTLCGYSLGNSPPPRSRTCGHGDAMKYTGWPELPASSAITPERWIEFFTAFQLTAQHFHLGVMPFEALDLQYASGGHAFCVCGIGYTLFGQIGASLFLILQKILPVTDASVSSKIQSVAQHGGNGFELLWVLTKHFVPMIATTKQLTWPSWPHSDDIFLFARRVQLYCTLSRLRGQKPFTPTEMSEMFLQNTQGPYRDYARHFLTSLQVIRATHTNGELPPDMKYGIHDLAERLMDASRDDINSTDMPSNSRIHHVSSTPHGLTTRDIPSRHIQGYSVNVIRASSNVPRAPPNPSRTAARRGLSHTRRPPYEGTCDACGRYGHQASTCDMLGMAIFLRKYSENRNNKAVTKEAETAWMEKNKQWLPRDSAPSKILTRYCAATSIPIDRIDHELDWDLLYSACTDHSTAADADAAPQPDATSCNRVELYGEEAAVDWFNAQNSTPEPSILHSNRVALHHPIPPGSLLDPCIPSSPLSDFVGEFDHLRMNSHTPTSLMVNSPHPSPGITGALGLLRGQHWDSQHATCYFYAAPVTSLPTNTSLSPPCFTLADSGSNVCLTNDLSLLHSIQDMEPRPLDVALGQNPTTTHESMCTKFGYMSLPLLDGTIHQQKFLYNASATETIISPDHIVQSSDNLHYWIQGGSSTSGSPGCLLFFALDATTLLLSLTLEKKNGLYYSSVQNSVESPPAGTLCVHRVSAPVSPTDHLTSELWAARLGYCGIYQLDNITSHVKGVPPKFAYHPMRFIDIKEEACVQRQPRGKRPDKSDTLAGRFFMDFGFLRASSCDYGVTPSASPTDRIVMSFDGYNCFALIIDECSRRSWVFPRKSKEPPVSLVALFLQKYGSKTGGSIRCDQGGELSRSTALREMAMKHLYTVEPTGADSPSQNGGVERWNGTLAKTVRALLYGAGLPPQYWSAALIHAVYLHNRRVHVATRMTPYEAWNGQQPDLSRLRIFGSRVMVKQAGERPAKLDKHSYCGIFLGYSATDHNIRYLDLDTGMVKVCHHAVFDEAWYTQPQRPPTAQHLYNLGLQPDVSTNDEQANESAHDSAHHTDTTDHTHLDQHTLSSSRVNHAASIVHEFNITHSDIRQVYFSPSPFNDAFEEMLPNRLLTPRALSTNALGGLKFHTVDERLYLIDITPGTPFAQLPRWRSRLKGAWLININGNPVLHESDVIHLLHTSSASPPGSQCVLLFAHPEIKHGLTNDGIPQISIDQLNNTRHSSLSCLPPDMIPPYRHPPQFRIVHEHDDYSLVSNATRLTRGQLMKQDNWDDWKAAERLQWDQYDTQGMLGIPYLPPPGTPVFNIVWQYAEKEDGRKKARATCDGSSRGHAVRVLDHTYAGTPDQVGQRIFYATCSVENMVIYGSDASNAFAEAGPPRQGINLRLDRSFHEWWVSKDRPPLPNGFVVPLLSAMQGHPESPRLWERHIDKILRLIGFIPTTHEPCLYSGTINNHRVLLLRQVDDFAVGAATASICDLIFDLMDTHLKIPLKRLGLVTMYNGVNVDQTKHYIKISCESYIEKICDKHLTNWMRLFQIPALGPTPLPTTSGFMKPFLTATGDPTTQKDLEKKMKISYRSAVGELIYALVTCRPDISHAVVRCAQSCTCPHEIHYHAVKHLLKYLYCTKSTGLYYWRECPNDNFPDRGSPQLSSTEHDLLLDGRPQHSITSLHGYVDSDWATCPKTRRSMTGVCIRLAGGTIAYKTKLQPTVAQSSTEAEFMGASDFGKIILYIRSVLWDIGIPQESASFLYEDNDACTAMAMAQKPTPRTRHMDIKFHSLCEWVERDLIKLERIDTTVNMADHFTKILTPVLFRRHTDYIMGKVPPHYSQCHPLYRVSPKSIPSSPSARYAQSWFLVIANP